MSRPKFQLRASEEKEDFCDLIGKDLTFKNDIVSHSGNLMHAKGEAAFISDVIYTSGYWSNICTDIYVSPRLDGIKINGVPSTQWRPDTFIEFTKDKYGIFTYKALQNGK